ncbi:MAG: PIG-L family deacetylase, partial [candidate division KSB1 bacterium]|nr:PIG-L family deacetylase [candidate division KSB1 bacterium]
MLILLIGAVSAQQAAGGKLSVIVFGAHPDDCEFGAAGTIARWIREGRSVVYVLCTS